MIISSAQLGSMEQDLDDGSIGDYILGAMRRQRKDNVLCDAKVKCGEVEFPVHRSVLYAYSLYCRKLFSGSFPPKTEDCMTIIDLSLFSEDIVKVFLDLLYGDQPVDPINIEVEELLKLTDFLQAGSDIEIVTEILRKMLNLENCLELYKLAGTYNFHKFQTVVLTYISDNLDSVINSSYWKSLDEKTLFSILGHPVIQCRPGSLVGGALKSYFSGKTTCNLLMGIDFRLKCSSKTEMCFHRDEDKSVLRRNPVDLAPCQLYFVFRKELYCIKECINGTEYLCKYSQHSKKFITLQHSGKYLKSLSAAHALTDKNNDSNLIIMCTPNEKHKKEKHFALVKISMNGHKIKRDVVHVTTNFKVHKFDVVYNPKSKKIFFFNGELIHIYSLDSGKFVENLINLVTWNKTTGKGLHYTEFKGHVYAVICEKKKLTMHILNNETSFKWDLYLEQELEQEMYDLKLSSSSDDLAIILESKDDSFDHIYKLKHESKSLEFYKNSRQMDTYLFVPEHIYY